MSANTLVILPATESEQDWAAGLLAASEPWTKLGISREQCLRNCRDPESQLFIARHGRRPCGALLIECRGAGYRSGAAVARCRSRHRS